MFSHQLLWRAHIWYLDFCVSSYFLQYKEEMHDSTCSQSIFRKLVLIKGPSHVSIWQRKSLAKFEIIFCKQNAPVVISFVSFEGSRIDLSITRIRLFIGRQLIIVMYVLQTLETYRVVKALMILKSTINSMLSVLNTYIKFLSLWHFLFEAQECGY